MPPVIFLALIGAAGIAGYKLLSSLVDQAKHVPRRDGGAQMRRATAPARDLGQLEWDDAAGVYRPRHTRDG